MEDYQKRLEDENKVRMGCAGAFLIIVMIGLALVAYIGMVAFS